MRAILIVLAAVAVIPFSNQPVVAQQKPAWQSLFDGNSLGKWKPTEFGGEGEVKVEDSTITLGFGNDLTGITWTGEYPKNNYEISFEARRVEGDDFFCGLTFPVSDSPCTLILGGWGGSVVGLSSLNGLDASENETTKRISFKNGQWYKVRLRVEPDRIQAWLDDNQIVDQSLKDKKLSIRSEVDLSRPLGIAAWQTKSAMRNIRIRKLDTQ